MKKTFLFNLILCVFLSINSFSQIYPTDSAKTAKTTIQTPPPPIRAKNINGIITSPKDGSSFINSFEVTGIVKKYSSKNHLWLIVSPRESNGCWPQYKEIRPDENTGSWNGQVKIGGDDGKLLDIILVSANNEANKFFNDYIENQVKDNFPTKPMPEGATSLSHITVIKAPKNDTTSKKINPYYGFSKSGVFYIHKSLIEQSKGDIPCLVAGITNWENDIKMQVDGDYYIYQAKIDRPYNIKLEYCFYIGNGIYLPQLLIEISSSLIKAADYKINTTKDGNNFYTSPQDYYPGTRN